MRYHDQLAATTEAVVALAERTHALRDWRRRTGRRLSVPIRTDLAATAVRLRATADRLDELATVNAAEEQVARLVAEARRLGVPV